MLQKLLIIIIYRVPNPRTKPPIKQLDDEDEQSSIGTKKMRKELVKQCTHIIAGPQTRLVHFGNTDIHREIQLPTKFTPIYRDRTTAN